MKGFVYDSVQGVFTGMRSGFFKPLIGILALVWGYAVYALPFRGWWVFLEWFFALLVALGGWSELLGAFGFGMSILLMVAMGVAFCCYVMGDNDKVNWFVLWSLSVVYYGVLLVAFYSLLLLLIAAAIIVGFTGLYWGIPWLLERRRRRAESAPKLFVPVAASQEEESPVLPDDIP